MGWLYTFDATRRDIIEDVTRTWSRNGVTSTAIARAAVGNHLWVVFEQLKDDGTPAIKPDGRFICLFILDRGCGDGWGYKDVSESMGPTAVSCPLKYLKMVPTPPNEYGREWREHVKVYWQRRAERRRARKTARMF